MAEGSHRNGVLRRPSPEKHGARSSLAAQGTRTTGWPARPASVHAVCPCPPRSTQRLLGRQQAELLRAARRPRPTAAADVRREHHPVPPGSLAGTR